MKHRDKISPKYLVLWIFKQHNKSDIESKLVNSVTVNFNLHVSKQMNILNQLRASTSAKNKENQEKHCSQTVKTENRLAIRGDGRVWEEDGD